MSTKSTTMRRIRVSGPAKSGKTQLLIEIANMFVGTKKIIFMSPEIHKNVLRMRGLSKDVPIRMGEEECIVFPEEK